MKRNMYDWVREQIAAKRKKAMPVLSFPGIQFLNITVSDLVASGELQAKCMKAIADRYPTAAAVSNMDLSLEAEAFGAKVRFSDDEVPTVVGMLVDGLEDAGALRVPPVGAGRTGEALEAVRRALDLIRDRPVFAGVIGPFSLAGRLMDFTEIMVKCMIEPEIPHAVLEKVTAFLVDYIREYKKIGANGIVMAEPAAGLLSPDLCDGFSSGYVKRIIDAVQDENFIVIYHNCGNTLPLMDSIKSIGARVVHFGNVVSLAEMVRNFPPDTLVMGNIDPAGEFRNGTPESMRKAAGKLLEELSAHPNWVISSGCDIPPLTPRENIDAFFETVSGFYRGR